MKKSLMTLLLLSITSLSFADEKTSTHDDQSALNITIYNSNIALIKDQRHIQLDKGTQTLAFKDISAGIQPETTILKGKDLTLLEQNFEYDLLSAETLLNKYIGKTVIVATTNPINGTVTEQQATVLANNNGAMLKIGDKIRSLGANMSIIYDHVPENLRDKPTMTMTVTTPNAGEQALELTYLSHHLDWKADYIANLLDDKTLNLKGWVTLTNNSGTTYEHANLQLVAGDINRVQQNYSHRMSTKKVAMMEMADAAPNMQEESLFEYHLYTLGFPTTIKNKQQKQVSLLEASHIPYEKRLIVNANDPYGWRAWHVGKGSNESEYVPQTVNAKLVIDNKKANQLGLPLPAGIVRTYQNDSRGNMQFIGEDRITHTPENESLNLQMGKSFDVTVKRKQTAFNNKRNVKNSAVGKQVQTILTASYEILFKNAKDKDTIVDYQDNFFGDWEISKQSLNSEKLNSTLNRWRVNVPAKGETILTYTVTITH